MQAPLITTARAEKNDKYGLSRSSTNFELSVIDPTCASKAHRAPLGPLVTDGSWRQAEGSALVGSLGGPWVSLN